MTIIVVVQLPSCVWFFATPQTVACQASLSITNTHGLLKPMSIESVMPSNHLILCRSLLLPPSIFPSIRVFTNESGLRISSVQFSCSVVSESLWPHESQHARAPCPSHLPELLKPTPIESVMPSSHLLLCRPLLLLPPIPPSFRVFSNESVLRIRWPKYWSFNFSISHSNEHPGLISFRMDWLDLLAVQGTLKSLLQHHSSKASIYRRLAFFAVQLSHPYMTTGKTIALIRWTLWQSNVSAF